LATITAIPFARGSRYDSGIRLESAKAGFRSAPAGVQAPTGVFVAHLIKFTKINIVCNRFGLDFRKLFQDNPSMVKKSQHGGKREGAGRKPATPGERRDQVFSIKLTADEKHLLERTEARKWARAVLLSNAKRRVK
jgi:hypothetical protein